MAESRVGRKLDHRRAGSNALKMLEELEDRIIGQPEALKLIVEAYQTHKAGMNIRNRPLGNFLLLGPTGVGKTRTVEATAEVLYGKPNAFTKIDCGEFQHSHEIAKIIGSPPGYLGHKETAALLTQDSVNQYCTAGSNVSLVLFDEIEKASDALWNLLLSIMDKGVLTLGNNTRTNFTNSFIFMTGNLGAREMAASTQGMGFGTGAIELTADDLRNRNERIGIAAAHKRFTPEFINRLDKIIVYGALGRDDIAKILDLELKELQKRIIFNDDGFRFVFGLTPAAKQHLVEHGEDSRYGARHIKRAIVSMVSQPLSNLVMNGEVKEGDLINIDLENGEFTFQLLREGLDALSITQACSDLYHRPPVDNTPGGKSSGAKSKSGSAGNVAQLAIATARELRKNRNSDQTTARAKRNRAGKGLERLNSESSSKIAPYFSE